MHRSKVLVAAVAGTSWLVSACGTDTAGAPTAPSSSTSSLPPLAGTTTAMSSSTTINGPGSTPPSSASSTDSDAAFTAYVAAMDSFVVAVSSPPNPDNPELNARVGEPLLTEFRNLAAQWLSFGQAAKYPAQSIHRTTLLSSSREADRFVIEVCSVDDSILYEPATGKVLNDKVSTNRIRATLARTGENWVLTERQRLEQWQGVGGCAVTPS